MLSTIQYSVLSYYPSFLLTDNMTVGILFHDLKTDERRFETTTNFERLKTFDDELDIELFKMLLESIRVSACTPMDDIFRSRLGKKFNLIEFTRVYVNELKFSKVVEVNNMDFEEFVKLTKRIHLRYDIEKSKRPSKSEEMLYMNTILKSYRLNYNKELIQGQYQDNIKFDYIIEDKYAIKMFDIKQKDLNKLVWTARNWSFISREVKEKYNVIFIFSGSNDDESRLNSLRMILTEFGARVLDFPKGADFIASISDTFCSKHEVV